MLEVLYHHAKFGRTHTSPVAKAAKNILCVCKSVTLWNVIVSADNFTIKAL